MGETEGKGRYHLIVKRNRERAASGYVNPLLGPKDEVFEKNEGLLKLIANKWWLRVKHMGRTEFEDLYQEAALGMLIAYYGYEHEHVKFNTYAVPHANRRIQIYVNYKMNPLHIPISKRMDATFKAARVISANVRLDNHEDAELQDILAANPDDFTTLEIRDFIDGLTTREKKVLSFLIYGYNHQEIARVFGNTHQAVSATLKNIRTKYLFYQEYGRHKVRGEKVAQ